jgi:membrane-associated phospholipid phosphatase
MTKEQYIKITAPLREDEKKAKRVIGANQVLTGLIYGIYPLYLVVLFIEKNPLLLRSVIVPAVSFLLLTLVRRIINAPRPYEKFGMPPVIEKDTKGKSFPSRHVFSVFIIAFTIFISYTGAGIMIALIGAAIAVIRVIGGVHEPRDVIAGAIAGIAAGIIGFWIL